MLLNVYSDTFAYIQYTYTSLTWIMMAIAIISLVVLMASPRLCQTYPTNLLILGAFTIA